MKRIYQILSIMLIGDLVTLALNITGNYQYDSSKLPHGLYVYTIGNTDGTETQKGMFVIAK